MNQQLERPEIDPPTQCNKLTFDRGAKAAQWRK